ncbi:MAG TPA: ABC transporter permease [Stellaceae bacterium]|nr:ABC transporter permease [Stellaceae bacterium]
MPLVSGSVKLGFVLLLGIAWYVSSAHQLVNPLLVPSFTATMQDLWTLLRDGVFWPDLRITLYELVVAFAIASILGLAVGYAVSRTRYTIKVFDPLFSSLYSVPTILLFPLFVLFFGLGSGSKIAMGATIAFFPVVLTTIAGLGNAEVGLVKAARSMGASDWQMFWQIMLPASLPVVLGGLRIGMVSALLAILGTETIAAIGGLGHQIVNYSDAMDTPMMFAYTLLVLAIATALNSLVTALEGFARQRIA